MDRVPATATVTATSSTRASSTGLANHSKDSWDAIPADSTLAEAPVALCGSGCSAAYVARAHFAREAGDEARSRVTTLAVSSGWVQRGFLAP
jgi:hypothetical protein